MRVAHDRHLTEDEAVELVDPSGQRLPRARATHAEVCESCRRRVAGLRDVMLEAGDVHVPEPSPLFWKHLTDRIAQAVVNDRDASSRPSWMDRWRASHLATAITTASVVLAAVVGASIVRQGFDNSVVVSDGSDTLGGDVVAGEEMPVVEDLPLMDEPADWAWLVAMAETVEWDETDTDALMVDRRTLDREVFALSSEERRTLVRLLEAELVQ